MVRFKNRWLLLSVDTAPLCSSVAEAGAGAGAGAGARLNSQGITRLLRSSLSSNFGDAASGAFGGSLVCRYYSPHTGTAIVRCARQGASTVWAAATLLVQDAEGRPIRIRVTHLGGTIKKVQLRAIQLDTARIQQLHKKRDSLSKMAGADTNALIQSATNEIMAVTQ